MLKSVLKIIKPVIDMLTPSCEIITQKISKSMDAPLTLWEKMQVRVHISACKLCAWYRLQLLAIRRMITQKMNQLDENQVTEGAQLSPEARQRIKDRLNRETP